MSKNPSNKTALTPKVLENGAPVAKILQPANRVELTNNAPIATAATSTTPFGFATADQADDLVATVIELRAALVSLGLVKDDTANVD